MTQEEMTLLQKYINVHLYKFRQDINPSITSSLTAETVLRLFENNYLDQDFQWTDKFRNSPSTILYLEARSSVGNYLGYHRAQKRAALKQTDTPLEDLPSRQPQLPLDLQIDLKAFLERLDEKNQTIIKEYQNGFDYGEIAQKLSVSLTAIEKRLQNIQYLSAEYFQTSQYKRLKELRDQRFLKKAKRDLENQRIRRSRFI